MSYTLAGGRLDLDQEVVCIGSSSNKEGENDDDDSLACAICASDLSTLDVNGRQEHYELHFAEVPLSGGLSSPSRIESRPRNNLTENRNLEITEIPAYGTNNPSASSSKGQHKLSWKFRKVIERRDVFWYASLPTNPPNNFTPGLIPLLKKTLWSSHAQGATQKAALCYPWTVHISQDLWDKTWGCGYRNYLMACTALMHQNVQPLYFPLLDVSPTPGVRNLQQLIEDAWSAGFDKVGAQQLKHLKNTRKWIGTGDIWVAFSFRGIPAELVDFDLKNQDKGVNVILDWIVNYFSSKPSSSTPTSINQALMGASPITVTDRMPLILQHNGHSRLIVGYETSKAGQIDLLTFDPGRQIPDDIRRAAISLHEADRPSSGAHKPESLVNAKKRLSDGDDAGSKRARPSSTRAQEHDDDVVFVKTVASPSKPNRFRRGAEKVEKVTDPGKILSVFRIKTKKLSKKEYQILYFPMAEPLTENERLQRREVVSNRVC